MHFKNSLEEIVGPLVGHSSDGDSRWWKLMVQLMLSDVGERFSPISEAEGFVFSARKEPADSGYVLRDIGDQDQIHNHKKYINHLDLVSKVLQIGPSHAVLMNHIEMVIQKFPVLKHSLSKDHVRRERDRQNWKIAQELSFRRVQDRLEKIVDGEETIPPDHSVAGTKAFLRVIWHYVEIFFSPNCPLKERIKYAAFAVHFLAIWSNFIFESLITKSQKISSLINVMLTFFCQLMQQLS